MNNELQLFCLNIYSMLFLLMSCEIYNNVALHYYVTKFSNVTIPAFLFSILQNKYPTNSVFQLHSFGAYRKFLPSSFFYGRNISSDIKQRFASFNPNRRILVLAPGHVYKQIAGPQSKRNGFIYLPNMLLFH